MVNHKSQATNQSYINFLLHVTSIHYPAKKLWVMIPKMKLLWSFIKFSLLILKEMYVDQSGEFVCGSWGLKGQHYCICYKYLCRPVQAGDCSVPWPSLIKKLSIKWHFTSCLSITMKGKQKLSVNVFSTEVLIGKTIYISYWRWDRHFRRSFEPLKGLAICRAKAVPSFLSHFKNLSVGPLLGI